MTYFIIAGAVAELAGIVFTIALCRAAAKRPIYGPPVGSDS